MTAPNDPASASAAIRKDGHMVNEARPRFSIVSAVYNVAPYLPDFIASLESQTRGLDGVEVVMIDDGSTDGSAEVLAAWARRRPETVRVVTQENAGQGAARNAGIREARGEWVTFPDPDDVLAPRYLAAVEHFLDEHPDAHMVATHRLIWLEDSREILDTHPLRSMFHGDPYVDLTRNPERFHGSSPASFFRLDRIREIGLEFDSRIRPNFEDGHFNSRYLLAEPNPRVGFLDSARYRYRKRADGGSTLQSSQGHEGRYAAVMEHGYLDLVRRAQALYGVVPNWLASFLLYELFWYFVATDPKAPLGRPVEGPVAERFHQYAAEILGSLDLDEALRYVPASVNPVSRVVMQRGYQTGSWREPFVVLNRLDLPQQLVRATYYFTGPVPDEVWRSNGDPIEPRHAKVRDLTYYGRTLLRERIVWLPSHRSLQADIGGAPTDIVYERPTGPVRVAPPGQIRWWLNPDSDRVQKRIVAAAVPPTPVSKLGTKAQVLATTPRVQQRYADAWVLMDRVHDAADSAEILFRYLRKERQEINAWFVLEKGTPEWHRFRAEGHGDRLVAHGSLQWRLLMANATHLLSSHADAAITSPPDILEFTHPRWRFHFLQHGVIKDDLSAWLDPKSIDTFVVSTRQELASIAGDHTSYVFTTREVALTGLPRFDRLLEIGRRFPPDRRDLLLVAPTWRNGVLPPMIKGTQRRILDPSLLESAFLRAWMDYLADERLAAACEEHGVTLAFLPHPNLQPVLPLMTLPAHVQPLAYEGGDPQELFARARALVTDYSSIAFNAAYLERPVVYYQFDADTVLEGGHVGRRGYFDYRRDGFGPVVGALDEAVAATVATLAAGPTPTAQYQDRIDASFTLRDGRCCERVVEHVLLTDQRRGDLPAVPTPKVP